MSTIKKTKLILAFLFLGIAVIHGQSITDEMQFGIKGGINSAKLKNTDSKSRKGVVFGVFSEYALSDKFSIRSEVLFSSQGAKKNSEKIKLNYINVLPVLAKIYPTEKLSFEFGPQLGYLLSKKGGSLPKKEYKKIDYGLAFGIGYHIDENLEIGARYNLGLRDITDTPDTVKNTVFQFSLSFGF